MDREMKSFIGTENIRIKCFECRHKEICKFIADASSFNEKIKKVNEENLYKSFNVYAICEYFEKNN